MCYPAGPSFAWPRVTCGEILPILRARRAQQAGLPISATFGKFQHLIEVNRLTIEQCNDCIYGEGQPEPECDRKRWDFTPLMKKVLETCNLNLFKESEFNKWRKKYDCPMNIPKIP